jgi:hypothetical protein
MIDEDNQDYQQMLKEQQAEMTSNEPQMAPSGNGGGMDVGNILNNLFGPGKNIGQPQRFYTDMDYQGINDTYQRISDTYQPPKFVKNVYEPFKYESPTFESGADDLFGPARGESFINSPALKETGIREALMEPSEKNAFTSTGMSDNLFGGSLADSPLFKPTGMTDQLLWNLDTPIFKPESAGGQPMSAPSDESILKMPSSDSMLQIPSKTNLFGNPIAENPYKKEGQAESSEESTEEEGSIPETGAVMTGEESSENEETAEEAPEETLVAQNATVPSVSTPALKQVYSIPKPVVSQSVQSGMPQRRGPGRPRLSDEEKARRRAQRANEAGAVAAMPQVSMQQ